MKLNTKCPCCENTLVIEIVDGELLSVQHELKEPSQEELTDVLKKLNIEFG